MPVHDSYYSSQNSILGEQHRLSFRVILVGNSMVGKTSLMVRACYGRFSGESATIGAEHFYRVVKVGDRDIELEIWDTAGQERFRALVPLYYRKAYGAFVVYDVTSRASYNSAIEWAQELREKVITLNCIMMVGNKVDLVTEKGRRAVPKEEAEMYANQRNMLFLETSAKSGTNVSECLNIMAGELLSKKDEQMRLESYRKSRDSVDLDIVKKEKHDKPDCCK